MTGIRNGIGAVKAQQESVGRSLRALEDELIGMGYEPDPNGLVQPLGEHKFRAIAWGGESGRYRTEALGYSDVGAVQSLIRSIRLPYEPPKKSRRRDRRHQGNYVR
jgi:hypothetical protein